MRTIVRGKNLEVPDRVRQYAERKFARLERLLDDRTRRHRRALERVAPQPPRTRISPTSRSSSTAGRSQPRLRRHLPGGAGRRRRQGRAPGDRLQGEAPRPRPTRGGEDAPAQDRRRHRGAAPERQIVKTKRFAIEPMFEEDAVAAMEDLGHDFYVFVNAETEQVARPLQAQGRQLRADRAGRRRRVHGGPASGREVRPLLGLGAGLAGG